MTTLALSLVLALTALSACFRAATQTTNVANIAATPSPTAPRQSTSGIRSIDFRNFTYPAGPIFADQKKTFTLVNGELPIKRDEDGRALELGLFVRANYYDVTGDGIEDAVIGLAEDNGGGAAIVEAAYIYTMRDDQPVFLWGFEAGDRADGGLRSIYGQDGELVIELEGKDKVIGKNLYGGDDTSRGLCCPTFFTRTRYRWNGTRFEQKGAPEVLPLAGAPKAEPFPKKPPTN